MEQYSLFVLKVPLNPNKQTIFPSLSPFRPFPSILILGGKWKGPVESIFCCSWSSANATIACQEIPSNFLAL